MISLVEIKVDRTQGVLREERLSNEETFSGVVRREAATILSRATPTPGDGPISFARIIELKFIKIQRMYCKLSHRTN